MKAAHVGHIYRDSAFYADTLTGELKSKYFLVLAAPENDDIVIRLLTSRYAGLRPEQPPCFHGDPYPGYFLGMLGGELGAKSWLDLRSMEDLDQWDFARHFERARIRFVKEVEGSLLRGAMVCAANAQDTTCRQTRSILDALAGLPS